MRRLLPLCLAAALAAGDPLPRLTPFAGPGDGPAIPAPAADWTGYRDPIATWLRGAAPGLDPADPGGEALVEMLARWTSAQDGTATVSVKYGAIFIAAFNRYQAVAEAIDAAPLTPGARRAWRRAVAERLVRERLDLPAEGWTATLARVRAGGAEADGDDPTIMARIAALPWITGATGAERRRRLHALAALNPILEPDGWAVLTAGSAVPGIHAATPLADGRVLVERWRRIAPLPLWLPAEPPAGDAPVVPGDLGPAAAPALTVVHASIERGFAGRVPLRLQLAFRPDGSLDNGVATAPTATNRAWPVFPAAGDEPLARDADGGVTGLLRIELPTVTRAKSGRDLAVIRLAVAGDGTGSAVIALNGKPTGETTVGPAPSPVPRPVAAGASWRLWLGTGMDGRGPATGLVDDLERADLAWAAQDDTSDGRGIDTRGKAKVLPTGEPLSGAYATPVAADGIAVLNTYEPAGNALAYGAKDPAAQRINRILADDCLTAYDLATGAVRWERRLPGGVNWAGFNKGGPKLSAAIADGIVVALGTTGRLRAFDLATGARRWETDIGPRARQLDVETRRLLAAREQLSTRNDFMTDPVIIGRTVLVGDCRSTKMDYRYEIANGILAFDLDDGRLLWSLPERGPANRFYQGVQALTVDGQAMALIPAADGLRLVEPRTGAVRWHSPDATLHQQGLAAIDGILLAEEPEPAAAAKGWAPGLIALRYDGRGAAVAWRADPALRRLAGNAIARDGRFWLAVELPERQLVALAAADGAVLGRITLPGLAGGEHCPFLVDAGDRLIAPADRTTGLWWIRPDPAAPDPRFWAGGAMDLATGYCGSILPALVDGRMLLRARNRLLCYDLRAAHAPGRPDAAAGGTTRPPPVPPTGDGD
jgi:outer membrane protein assembly factor BamB